jgi:hypothetical protein
MIHQKVYLSALISMTILISALTNAEAQKIEISPFLGYETGARLHTSQGFLYIGGGMNYGGVLDYTFSRGTQLELSYSHMKSNIDVDDGNNRVRLDDLTVDYYSIGGLREFLPGETLVPYAMGEMGWVNYRPLTGTYSSENMMHVSIAGGVKYYASRRIGFRMQARLSVPIFYKGLYFTDGSSGSGQGLKGAAGAVQGDFTAALFIVI